MQFNPDLHHRRSIRLHGYDYALAGAYFITACTQGRARLFGEIVEGRMRLNAAGDMVWRIWNDMPSHYPGIDIDEFIVMPDHIHAIVDIRANEPRYPSGIVDTRSGGPPCRSRIADVRRGGPPYRSRITDTRRGGPPCPPCSCRKSGQPRGVAPTGVSAVGFSVADAVHRLKSMTTHAYSRGVQLHGWTPFDGRQWQRNYWEHIVRDEIALERIRRYIRGNPARWKP